MFKNFDSNDKQMKKGLYLVSTPIGNLNDITIRAIETLKRSNYILCEDTRVSKTLFQKHNIKSKLITNHKFNERKNVDKILKLLDDGNVVSLISDAGTPSISDPGIILVNECIKRKIDVIPIPGPSSVISAVSVSGFSEKFLFYGFFPEKKKVLEEDLNNLSNINLTIIFFISSKKFNKAIPILKKNFSDRQILICREMTKFYEEYVRIEGNKLDKVKFELKGELTLVISEKKNDKKNMNSLDESDKTIISKMIDKISIKEIVAIIGKNKKISKKEIYNYCLSKKNEK